MKRWIIGSYLLWCIVAKSLARATINGPWWAVLVLWLTILANAACAIWLPSGTAWANALTAAFMASVWTHGMVLVRREKKRQVQ